MRFLAPLGMTAHYAMYFWDTTVLGRNEKVRRCLLPGNVQRKGCYGG